MSPTRITDNLVSFASQIDDNTVDQAKGIASMPFVWPHVALMPDAHLGKGSSVGTVIPTKGAVIPAAVGVDIGCFVGDTRVPLLNGRQRTLKSMAKEGGQFWVYSLNTEQKIVPGRATALKTRTDAELMRVTVSGGDEIICTPDHEFMLNDGTYRQAQNLRFNDSLMPLYRRWQTRDGYESVSTGKGTSRQTHVLVYEATQGPVSDGHLVHHRNHIHFDNEPENLKEMSFSDHSAHHRAVGHQFNNACPEFQARRLAAIRAGNADPKRQTQMAEVGKANITRYMDDRPEHFAEAVAGNGERGAPYLRTFNTSPRACSECDHIAANPSALRWHKQREHVTEECNHKVIFTERLMERADVYCLQVEKHHNFALAAGVFVHNCGMIAAKTRFVWDEVVAAKAELGAAPNLAALREAVEDAIPLSPGNYNKNNSRFPWTRARHEELLKLAEENDVDLKHSPKWMEQLGSLGGGNHFIELCVSSDDAVWLFLHSGSRGVGNKIAQKHIKVAVAACKAESLPDRDAAYLTEGTPEFDEYIRELGWAQRFALLNREEMMDRFAWVFARWLGVEKERVEEPGGRVNCHHNYTVPIEIEGERVWLTRKGAIDASEGKMGLIPGSMGTASYVVRGTGNVTGLFSAPHGAGRRFSRTAAKKEFTLADLEKAMEGIEYRHGEQWIDEIPGAYKDIDQIMEDAKDLVTVVAKLKQVMNVKGT